LARLRHRPVDRADDEDGTVHLRRAGDHVLDVIGVARAVDVRVVPLRARVLDVARRDRQNLRLIASALRLGRLGDLVVRHELGPALVGRDLGECGGERRLAMIDVPDGADVHVRFASIEFFFGHVNDPLSVYVNECSGADDQNRTGDLVLTKDALCQLSYIGGVWSGRRGSNPRPTAWKAVTLPLSYS